MQSQRESVEKMVGDYQFVLFITNKGYIYIFTFFFRAENKASSLIFLYSKTVGSFFFKEEEKQIQVDKWGTHSSTP